MATGRGSRKCWGFPEAYGIMRCFSDMHDRSPSFPAACLAVACAALAGCGSHPGGPTPSPSPSATAQPGGTVAGAYTLQIVPSAACTMSRAPLSFPMAAAAAVGTSPHPGVQILLDPNGFRMEMEALSGAAFLLRGGLGIIEEGVVSDQGPRVWVHAVGGGTVQHALDARGEVATGTLAGYVALANADGDEGQLGTCTAADHAFALRAR
jgi:hypothetical protein